MDNLSFKALRVEEQADGTFTRTIQSRLLSDLPQNAVTIEVKFAALNYKDALSASGHKGITRNFPHTPGIDASGVVVEDTTGTFDVGAEVLVTSYDLGMNTDGGFGAYIKVPAEWVVPLPKEFTLQKAMELGTAGYTAGLALYKMEQSGQEPAMGPILVTGATGGVGSMAVSILAKAGYEVIASSGKADKIPYLKSLGATKVIDRAAVNDTSKKPFLKTQWAGAIDTVGGNTLTTIFKACGLNGNVAVCGLVGSDEIITTVYPFIIKGNNLLGVESATTAMPTRLKVWENLATKWYIDLPKSAVEVISLEDINQAIDKILEGKVTGRVLVKY